MRLNLKKRLLVIAMSIPCAFSMTGCLTKGKAQQNDSATETNSQSIESTIDTSDVTTSQTEEVVTKPSSFEDYIDETIPNNYIDVTFDQAADFDQRFFEYGTYSIGMGNPMLLEQAKTYFGKDIENITDVKYLSDTRYIYNGNISHIVHNLDMNYIRYVMEENDLKLWVDEIPIEYFEEKFPEYVEICNQGRYSSIDIGCLNEFYEKAEELHYDGELITVDYNDSNLSELLDMESFYQLTLYNYFRYAIYESFPADKGGPIKIGCTEDGKYVWTFSEKTYKALNADLQSLPNCENINILVPETKEDLKSSGIDVEAYEEYCEKVFGGAKSEDLEKDNDGGTRSRG